MMKLLWIPITLFLGAVLILLITSLSAGNGSLEFTMKGFMGQGLMIPFFFFVLLFMWKFNRTKHETSTS